MHQWYIQLSHVLIFIIESYGVVSARLETDWQGWLINHHYYHYDYYDYKYYDYKHEHNHHHDHNHHPTTTFEFCSNDSRFTSGLVRIGTQKQC